MLRGRSRLITQGDFLQLAITLAHAIMSISSQSGSIYTDLSGLDQLKYKLKGDSVADLRVAAQQFEALFIQQMLKTMREAKLSDGAFDSNEGDMYVEMLDKQLSLNLSQGKGIGLTDIIVKQLSHSLNLKPEQRADNQSHAAGNTLPVTPPMHTKSLPNRAMDSTPVDATDCPDHSDTPQASSGGTLNSGDTPTFTDPSSFIKTFWPLAVKASSELGVAPHVLLAQAALETGWGRYTARREDGSSSYNLFNIKTGSSWQGDSVTLATTELKNGIPVKEYAAFRAYDSYEASFKDYVALIKTNPRYQDALRQATNTQEYAAALQNAGYATDSAYADKIVQIAKTMPLKF